MTKPAEYSKQEAESLRRAFQEFGQLNEELSRSYQALQDQVAQLTTELDFVKRKNDSEAQSRQQLRSKYAGLLNLLPAGIVVINSKGEITEANPFAVELLGVPLLGRRWLQIIQLCFAPQTDDGHEVSLMDGKRVKLETRALDFEPGQIILITDQTATRNLQKQVSQSERLSALGKMSSALAHQIRTPLSAALLNAGNLRDMPLSPEQTQRIADKLCKNLQQLEGQVRDMLVFSRANIALQDTVTLPEFCDAIVESLSDEFAAAHVSLRSVFFLAQQEIAENEWMARVQSLSLNCNRATLLGALANLLQNALQASEHGQKVECHFKINGNSAEPRITILIIDEGEGISPDLLTRINQGENFATSKAQGTGLGLTVVRAVSAAHKAHFVIDSEHGVGTTAGIAGLQLLQQVSTGNVVDQRQVEPA